MRYIPINVSKKILVDISSGIYRTPANALKELVSNAFDASAHRVFISTNVPYFDVFTCEDDGEGITSREFEDVLKIIGSSRKRMDGVEINKGRPIIGKIGIGLLAVAQICHKFTVISKKAGEKTYFEATIGLRQFEQVDKDENHLDGIGKISLGRCKIEDGLIDEAGSKRHYTKIIMEDLKQGFRTKLLEEEPKRIFKITEKAVKSENLIKFIESVKKKNFNELSQYDQLVWELGILCPVEYIDRGPFPDTKLFQEEIDKLKKYNFKVFIDGLEIGKPIIFPTDTKLKEKNVDYKIYPPISFSKKIDGAKLSFTGYLFHQRTKLQPTELQGILIRIKGVAIGGYDRTFLHYPKAEGPMFNQLSGEIFVEQGLEEALNIDRNSFNEAHPHLLKLQEVLWIHLGGKDGVFKDIRKRSKERSDIFHADQSEQELLKTREAVKSLFNLDINLEKSKKKSDQPYSYGKTSGKVTFYSHPFWTKNWRQRLIREKLVLGIIAAKEVSTSINSFENNLIRLFSRGK